MALPLLAGIGKLLGGKKILSGAGKLIGGLLKKKAGGTVAGNAVKSLGGVPGLISLGSSALAGSAGRRQQKAGREALANLKDPGYQIPEEYKTNLAQAEQMARQGLPAEQYNLATTNIQRGTQAGLRQLGRMSNPFAGISGLARTQSDALASLDASNAAARRQNLLGAMGARRELAGQKLAQQQYAQQRYMDQVNQANAMIGAGMQNVAGGLSGIGNTALMLGMYGAGGGQNSKNQTSNPFSPVAMNVLSNYNTPSVNTNPMSFADWQMNKNMGNINFGAFKPQSRFSGFGFK